jgi:hypothetical protein
MLQSIGTEFSSNTHLEVDEGDRSLASVVWNGSAVFACASEGGKLEFIFDLDTHQYFYAAIYSDSLPTPSPHYYVSPVLLCCDPSCCPLIASDRYAILQKLTSDCQRLFFAPIRGL